MDIIDVRNVTRIFKTDGKDFYALKNVSFSIKNGEIFGLLGPNGAGKTTLLNILTTLLLPDKGTAYINRYDVRKDRYKILQIINFVSGETRFHHMLSVNEILDFYSDMYGLSKSEKKNRIHDVVNKFEIKDLLEKRFQWLSSGERMKVILAKSLLNHPKVLFLDDPTLGLDPDNAVKTRNLISELKKEWKITILLTSHHMAGVEQLCKRIAFINKGEIIFVGGIKELKRKYPTLEDYFIKIAGVKK